MKRYYIFSAFFLALIFCATFTYWIHARNSQYGDSHAYARTMMEMKIISADLEWYLQQTRDSNFIAAICSTNGLLGNRILHSISKTNEEYFGPVRNMKNTDTNIILDRWGHPYRINGRVFETNDGKMSLELVLISDGSSKKKENGKNTSIHLTNVLRFDSTR